MTPTPPQTPAPWSGHDLFDEVPVDPDRPGRHRQAGAARPPLPGTLKAILAAGLLSLLVGAAAFLLEGALPSLRAPQDTAAPAPTTAEQAPGAPSSSASATAPSSAQPSDGQRGQVGVFNAAQVDGAAGAVSARLTDAGWQVVATENWGSQVRDSVVYHAPGEKEKAQQAADQLGIRQVTEEEAVAYPVVVVVGADLAGQIGGSAPSPPQSSAPAAPQPSVPAASQAPAPAQPQAPAPAGAPSVNG